MNTALLVLLAVCLAVSLALNAALLPILRDIQSRQMDLKKKNDRILTDLLIYMRQRDGIDSAVNRFMQEQIKLNQGISFLLVRRKEKVSPETASASVHPSPGELPPSSP